MCPLEPSLKLVCDAVEFGVKHVPWNTISISGYHIREAGSTAVQELAFTLRDGIEYVDAVIRRKGLNVDSFASRLSFFFNSHIDFFEEIAKLRAARRMWARTMRDPFKAKKPRSWWMRFHTQTAGCSHCPAALQQPRPHRIGSPCGCPGRHPVSPYKFVSMRFSSLPSDHDLAACPPDPADHRRGNRGGQYNRSTRRFLFCRSADERIGTNRPGTISRGSTGMGGMAVAIEKGFPQLEIADSAYQISSGGSSCEKIMVGVNKYTSTGKGYPIKPVEVEDTPRNRSK